MAAVKAGLRAGAIRCRRGDSPQRARKPARTNPPPSSSFRAATLERKSRQGPHHGAFGLEGSVRRRLSAQEGGGIARVGPARNDPDLEPTLDHPAAIRRADLRRLQRAEAYSGAGDRGDGRSQVRRVRADADVLRPLVGSQGQAFLRSRERGCVRRQLLTLKRRTWARKNATATFPRTKRRPSP